MVTAKNFVDQIVIPYVNYWGYIYGTWGTLWTAEKQDKIEKTTDENREMSRLYGSQWIGRMVTDCSGLVRWSLYQLGETIVHHARYQYTSWCSSKGKLVDGKRDDGEEILPGTAVFLKGDRANIHHVGVYIGKDTVIEAKGAKYGVVTSHLNHWDHWGELQMVDYTDADQIDVDISRKEEPISKLKAIVDNPNKWLNVRSGAGSSCPVRYQVPKGATVDVLTQEPEWWQIKYGGQIGWAFAEYLKLIDDSNDTEEPEEEPDEKPNIDADKLCEIRDDLLTVRTKLKELHDEVNRIIDIVDGYEA